MLLGASGASAQAPAELHAVPEEFQGLWAYASSTCHPSEHGYDVPVDGVFIGNVSFGTYHDSAPAQGQAMLANARYLDENTLVVKIAGYDVEQTLRLTARDRMTLDWGARGRFDLVRCSANG